MTNLEEKMCKPTRLRRLLRRKLDEQTCPLRAIGTYDALSAILVEREGFDIAYIGSYGSAASAGLPDVGILTMDQMVANARLVADAVDIPVLADAENGFYNAAAIGYAVCAFERTGVAGIHIDDHESGKHSALPPRVLDADRQLQNLRAALDAREDPDFMIIARTDVAWATGRVEDAVERMIACCNAGADAVFATGVTAGDLAPHRKRIPGKVILVAASELTVAQARDAGIDLLIYHTFSLYAASVGIRQALRVFKNSTNLASLGSLVCTENDFESGLSYNEYNARAKRYGMI